MAIRIVKSPITSETYKELEKMRISPGMHWAGRTMLRGVTRVQFGPFTMDVSRAEGVKSPAVLATTHRSWADIPHTERVARKLRLNPLRFMYKEGYHYMGLDPLFFRLGGFPVERKKPNLLAINRLQKAMLEQGHSVGVYPEGTRRTEKRGYDVKKVEDLTRGSAQTALRNNCQIVPVAIAGLAESDEGRSVVAVAMEPIEPLHDAFLPLNRRADVMTDELTYRLQEGLDIAYDLRQLSIG